MHKGVLVKNVHDDLEWLDSKPTNEQEIDDQFAERREIIDLLIEKVVLRKSQDPEIIFKLDLSNHMEIQSQGS